MKPWSPLIQSVSAEFILQGECRQVSVELTVFESKQDLGLH